MTQFRHCVLEVINYLPKKSFDLNRDLNRQDLNRDLNRQDLNWPTLAQEIHYILKHHIYNAVIREESQAVQCYVMLSRVLSESVEMDLWN